MRKLENWNEQICFSVSESDFNTPEDISEVQSIVKKAFTDNQKISVIGAMHSTTECMVGTGCIISMRNMDNILLIDANKKSVTVEAGVSLTKLCQALKPVDLQPPVNLEFGNYHIGAISGTHANDTSLVRKSQFSSFVIGAKLVTPTGEILEVSESQNAELLPYIRSHFGLLGVVCEITLRVFENKPLLITSKTVDIDDLLNNFEDEIQSLKASQDQAFGMLFPYSGKIIWECRKFVDKETDADRSYWTKLEDKFQAQGPNLSKDYLIPIVKASSKISTDFDSVVFIEKVVSSMVVEKSLSLFRRGGYIINPCDRGIVYEESAPGFDFYDWVFPEQDWCNMLRAFLKLCETFRNEKKFILTLPTLIYFIKHDESSMLSRSRYSNMMTIDPTYPNPETDTWKDFRLEFNKIAMVHKGIPHINKTRDGAIEHFADAFDPTIIRDYLQKRKELDPKDLFLNDFFKTLFKKFLPV